MPKLLLSLALIASLGYPSNTIAQQLAPALPAYDIVVVKPNNGLTHHMSMNMDETTLRAENVSLKVLLVNAYGIREGLMFGLPGWAGSSRFDVTAKVSDPDMKALTNFRASSGRRCSPPSLPIAFI